MDPVFAEKRSAEAAKHRGQGRTVAELQAAYHEFMYRHRDECLRAPKADEPAAAVPE